MTLDYGTVALVHARLNIADSVTSVDDKIADYLEESDEYINTQLGIFEVTPPTSTPPELIALGSSLAAAIYNYWNSPEKQPEGMKMYKKSIQDYIKAIHAKQTAEGLAGEDNILKALGNVTGLESG
jgi:hypothetical protein